MDDGDTGRSLSISEGAEKLEALLLDPVEPVRAREKTPGPEKAQADEPEEDEAEAPEGEAADDEAKEKAPDDDTSEDTETETEEAAEFTTFDELAEALEKSPDDLMAQLKTTIKLSGKEEAVTLAELKAGYQRGRDYAEKTTEVKRQREALDSESTQARQYFEQQATQNALLLQAVEQLVIKPPNQAEMDHLRQSNPAEWSARVQEYQAQAGYLQNLKQQAALSIEQHRSQAQQHAQAQYAERLESERTKLDTIPGWGEKLRGDLFGYLAKDYGYSEQELGMVSDHRIIDLVRKARAYDQQQQQTDVAKKKVRELPKLVAPSKPETKTQVKRSAIEQARAKLRKSGRREDAAALIERFL